MQALPHPLALCEKGGRQDVRTMKTNNIVSAASLRASPSSDVNALNASLVVVKPNIQPGSNWTVVERSIMKTWRVVERVVRENNPVHGEGFFCGTYRRSRTEILDNTLHNRASARHISASKLDKVGDKDDQRYKKKKRTQGNPKNSHNQIDLLALKEPHEKQSNYNGNQWMGHPGPRKGPKSNLKNRLVACLCHNLHARSCRPALPLASSHILYHRIASTVSP